jgi:RNA polymerase sporulation-specific sigma factor
VRGHDENDIYQESLIAISKKAIPKFNPRKGMSFLNFAKMCINRHLITILHASNHRRKDMPINQAISLDATPVDNGDEGGNCLLSNVITDDKHSAPPYKEMANQESYNRSLEALKSKLSHFEILILNEYLKDLSYKEIARNVSRITGKRYKSKSCDNALLRIRKKSLELKQEDEDNAPEMF